MASPALCLWALAAVPAQGSLSPASYRVSALCSAPAAGHGECMGLRLVARRPGARPGARSTSPSPGVERIEETEPPEGSLAPRELLDAYGLASAPAPASQQTLAVIDAYDDPTAEHDLRVFDERYGLPACTSANMCFTKVKMGSPAKNAGWAQEIATDVEVAHGTCSSCGILLVEARSNSFAALEEAAREAERRGAEEISNSWGGPEEGATLEEERSGPFDHPGTVITASAGDTGYLSWDAEEAGEVGAVDFPASSPHVVAVGGTRLNVGPGGTWSGESVWNGDGAGGGGCSAMFAAAPWQQAVAGFEGVGCGTARAVADVAADADPYTGVAVYDSTPVREGGVETVGWWTMGGTSVAAPFIAATFALAGGAGGVEYPAQTLYEGFAAHPGSLHDVTVGSNGSCPNGFDEETGLSECSLQEEAVACAARGICEAGPGYDGPSGVGTPEGLGAFQGPGGSQGSVGAEGLNGSGASENVADNPGAGAAGEEGTGAGSGEGRPGSVGGGATSKAGGSGGGTGGPGAGRLLAGPALTRAASAALAGNHATTRVRGLAFTFVTSGGVRVKVTLARRVLVHGKERWVGLPCTLRVAAVKGRNSARLKLARGLGTGFYRLTLTPARGAGRSLVFHVR